MTATTDPTATRSVDANGTEGTAAEVQAFTDRLFGHFTSAFVTHMIDLGHRAGLFEALSRGPATSPLLAARSGLQERYVREWLGAIASAGIADYEPTTEEYALPPAHAACLSGSSELNVAPFSLLSGLLAQHIPPVARAFRDGGGVPYAEYRPGFTDVMDQLGRAVFDCVLVEDVVPLTGSLADRLSSGIRVLDIGCGTGHSTNVLARAFPASTFVGYDLAVDAIDAARREARRYRLGNVSFHVQDVAQLPQGPPADAIFAFDAIHDQTDPVGVLERVHDALAPGGVFVMLDIRASSHLEDNLGNPIAPMLYGISTLHCLTISLAEGGAGLGTVWGRERAVAMLRDAGFIHTEVLDVPNDPLDLLYIGHKSGDPDRRASRESRSGGGS